MSHSSGTNHPLGEGIQSKEITEPNRFSVDTYGGRLHVEWDAATPLGQLPFFIEFLKTTQLFDELVESCPLKFTSNNASNVRDILGSMMLSVLSGHTRYSHINALRGEGVNRLLSKPSILLYCKAHEFRGAEFITHK